MNYLLRLAIAFDGLVQATFPYGSHGVTISSRIGTAAAHQHRWGIWGNWLLDHTLGKDHCKTAIANDIRRAHTVIQELHGDPVVREWGRT